jgi:hypothetical protein
MQALIAWLGSAIAALISSGVLQFAAFKIILKTLFVVFLPILLFNVMNRFMSDFLYWANTRMAAAGGSPMSIQLSGLTAFLASEIGIIQGFSMLMSAIAIRLTFKLIPFVGR